MGSGHTISQVQQGQLPQKGGIYRATGLGGEPLTVLEGVVSTQVGRPIRLDIAYPAFRVDITDQTDGLADSQRTVPLYFTHGHLFGSLYTTFSRLLSGAEMLQGLPPDRVAATVNLSLIEFIYWLLGETGEGVGVDGLVERIYSDVTHGDDSLIKRLVESAVDALAPDDMIPVLNTSMEKRVLKAAATHLVEQFITDKEAHPASSSDRHPAQATASGGAKVWASEVAHLTAANRAYFIYGHTHSAFWEPMAGHSGLYTYNLGSWLVEPDHPHPDCVLLTIDASDTGLSILPKRIASTASE